MVQNECSSLIKNLKDLDEKMNIVERVVLSSRGIVIKKTPQQKSPNEQEVLYKFRKSDDSKKKEEYPFSTKTLTHTEGLLEHKTSPVYSKNLLIDDPNVPVREPRINNHSIDEERPKTSPKKPVTSSNFLLD